jgi:hypothetical protein
MHGQQNIKNVFHGFNVHQTNTSKDEFGKKNYVGNAREISAKYLSTAA